MGATCLGCSGATSTPLKLEITNGKANLKRETWTVGTVTAWRVLGTGRIIRAIKQEAGPTWRAVARAWRSCSIQDCERTCQAATFGRSGGSLVPVRGYQP